MLNVPLAKLRQFYLSLGSFSVFEFNQNGEFQKIISLNTKQVVLY